MKSLHLLVSMSAHRPGCAGSSHIQACPGLSRTHISNPSLEQIVSAWLKPVSQQSLPAHLFNQYRTKPSFLSPVQASIIEPFPIKVILVKELVMWFSITNWILRLLTMNYIMVLDSEALSLKSRCIKMPHPHPVLCVCASNSINTHTRPLYASPTQLSIN